MTSSGVLIVAWIRVEPLFTHVVDCFVLATVDLSDESGNLKYLADHPTTYATEILKARESFVLIRVESKLLTSSRVVYSQVKKKL